ncbi:MAG: ribosomal protein S18-alanine N-acetyltransferase [Geobacteraceae bacterium]|nr:ribosomal protein S18-alanine N-acetyltransferase [Geobacteraceae bacterium]
MLKVTLQPVTEADLEEILELERASFQHPWSRDHILNEIYSPLSFPLLARLTDGTCAGYICPMLVLDEGQILNVAVKPSCRGKGIGRTLVAAALEEFRKRAASFVALEVRPSNAIAIALYRDYGFVATGHRKSYYENGEDAILMKLDFKGQKEEIHAV